MWCGFKVCLYDLNCVSVPCLTFLLSSCGTGGNIESVFDIEKSEGTIIIAKPLDAEQCTFYNLTVLATDGTNAAHVQVPHFIYLTNPLLVVWLVS